MKNSIIIILINLLALTIQAQVSTAYKTQVETIFQVDRSYVTTGLLQDYGFFYTNVEKFNGVRSDTSYLEYSEWQSLYSSLYTYRFNTNATLPNASTIFNQITSVANQNAGRIVFAGLHYRYERFKSNAGTSNLVYISNNKIYDQAGRSTTPYEVKEAFAMVPYRSVLEGATHTFLFKPELFYSNTGKIMSTLKIDFNDGAGYRTVTANTPLSITYSTEGEKKLIFKVTYTDGSIVESHTKILVRNIPSQQTQARYAGIDTAQFYFPRAGFITKSHNGGTGGALVTVEYATAIRTIRKPLIILGGLDAWKIIHPDEPDENFTFEDIIDLNKPTKNGNLNTVINSNSGQTLGDTLQSAGYDLIFVDYRDGTDYIQRNAYVLESVIQWINSVKQPYNGAAQKNVIVGFSMGGIVARYALCDMEKFGITHQTRLNVSFDSPHQGSNIPLGFQAATLHLAGSGIAVGLPNVTVTPSDFEFGNIVPKLGRAKALQNEPASRQLLRYQVSGGA